MNILTNETLKKHFYLKFKINESDVSVSNSNTLITQDEEEANIFLNEHDINYNIDNFDPYNKWIGINMNKIKFKWKEIPLQTKNKNGHLYSIFEDFQINENNNYLMTIIPGISGMKIYFVNSNRNTDESLIIQINKIKASFRNTRYKSKTDVNYKYLLVPHIKKKFTKKIDPHFKIPDYIKMKDNLCIDHYEMTIDRHGIYLNKMSRNKINLVRKMSGNFYILKADIMWIENEENGNIIIFSTKLN